MLHVRIETICFLIVKAHEFQSQEQVVLPELPEIPTEDWALETLADHTEDPCLNEVQEMMGEMNERQRAEVIALMWVGRGDYDVEDWESAVEDALEAHSERAAEYLLAHPTVAEDLEEGLIQLGYSCEE
jgi:hypothetical protein